MYFIRPEPKFTNSKIPSSRNFAEQFGVRIPVSLKIPKVNLTSTGHNYGAPIILLLFCSLRRSYPMKVETFFVCNGYGKKRRHLRALKCRENLPHETKKTLLLKLWAIVNLYEPTNDPPIPLKFLRFRIPSSSFGTTSASGTLDS